MSIGTEETPSPVVPAAQPEINPFARIAGVLMAPVRTFAEIAARPDILVPLVLILVVAYASTFAVVSRMDFDAVFEAQAEQMKKQNPNMSDEDIERAGRIGRSFGKGLAYVQPLLFLIWYAIVAGVLLLAFRLFGGEGDFKQAFSVTLYSWMPYVILSIITTIVVVVKGSFDPMRAAEIVKSNAAFLIDMKAQPVLYALVSMFDVFTFWVLALLTIGFAKISRFSIAKSAAFVIPLWLIIVVIRLGFAAMGAARMQG